MKRKLYILQNTKTPPVVFLIFTLTISHHSDAQSKNQIDQTIANINNQLTNLEFQKAQVNQQYEVCLALAQAPQMPSYYFGGDDVDITLAQGNALLAQTAQMTTCGQTASYQLNQIEYARSSLLSQRSMLEQQNRANFPPAAATNNIAPPTLPPASTSAPASEADKMQSLYYRQRADEAHQRQLDKIREQGNFNLRKDCNNSGGTWGGRSIGCY